MIGLWRNDRGDTIVEVLIALAILTLVLGGAYYTANRSYRNDRDSQEHTEALTVAQTQIEAIREDGNSKINDAFLSASRTYSCIDVVSLGLTSDCWVESNATSQFQMQAKCQLLAPYCYQVLITEFPVSLTEVTATTTFQVPLVNYEVQVSWPGLGGGTDSVSLYYRWDI